MARFPSRQSSGVETLLHRETPPLEFIPSSRPQYDAQDSPDGKRIVFDSLRSGRQGVWISDEGGGNLVQISDPRYISGSPQWSPDSSKIAFDSIFPGPLGNLCGRCGRTEASKWSPTSPLHFDLAGLAMGSGSICFRRSRQGGGLSLSCIRRRRQPVIQRYLWVESAGVIRWEDSLFCQRADSEEKWPCQAGLVQNQRWTDRFGCQIGLGLQMASILFLPMRQSRYGTSISQSSEYGRCLKRTALSVMDFRPLRMAAGSSIRRTANQPATSCSSITFIDSWFRSDRVH